MPFGSKPKTPDYQFEINQYKAQQAYEYTQQQSQMLDMIDAMQAQMAEAIKGMTTRAQETRSAFQESREDFQQRLDEKYASYVGQARENARVQSGQSRQRSMWLARRDAEDEAIDFVDKYIATQSAQAALTGQKFDVSSESRHKLISGRLADIWSEEYENELSALVNEFGNVGSKRYSRGQAGLFEPQVTNITGISFEKTRQTEGGGEGTTVLSEIDDDEEVVLGGPTLLGG